MENLNDDEEQDASPRKRTRGEVDQNDEKEQATSAPLLEGGRGGPNDAMGDDDNCGGQIDYDWGDENGDVDSEEGTQSHVVPEEIAMVDANDNDVDKEDKIRRLTAELEEAKNAGSRFQSDHEQQQLESKDLRHRLNGVVAEWTEKLRSKEMEMKSFEQRSESQMKEANSKVEGLSTELKALRANLKASTSNEAVLNTRLKEMTDLFEGARAQSKGLRARLNESVSQVEGKTEIMDKLKEEIEELKIEKGKLESQLMKTRTSLLAEIADKEAANVQLKEVTQKLDAAQPFWKAWWEKKNMQRKLNIAKSQLKEKSDAAAELMGKVKELKKQIKKMAFQVEFATLELAKAELPLAEAKAKIEELQLQAKAKNEEKPFKVKFSKRMKKQEREKWG